MTCSTDLSDRLKDVLVGMRDDLHVSRHSMADGTAYVVHHPVTFQSHRLSADDYLVFCHLDGKRTLGEVFDVLVSKGILDEHQPDAFYNFVIHMNSMGVLNLPITDGKHLHQKYVERKEMMAKGGINKYLFFRIPLFNSDQFLDRTKQIFAPMFTRTAVLIWLVAMMASIGVVIANWSRFSDPLGSLLATENLVMMWGLLLGLKVVHEFGHAYACKYFGGRVPEMGAYFMMLSPCAYVDASSSWSFPSRTNRIIVAMAGMYFESIASMCALAVWCFTSPGPVNSAAQLAIVLSTVVTIGFNVNPLMKYDGYFALSDVLGLPHLQQDSIGEFQGAMKKVLFGIDYQSVATTKNGRTAYQAFGFASIAYRVLIMVAIGMTLATFFPAIAPFAVIFMFGSMIVKSVVKLIVFLKDSEELIGRRSRATMVTAGLAGLAALGIASLPIPGATRAPAIVVSENQQIIHAPGPGFLQVTPVENGNAVEVGQVICRLTDQALAVSMERDRQQVNELEVELLNALNQKDPRVGLIRERLKQAQERFGTSSRMLNELVVRTPVAGIVGSADNLDVPGRFVQQGEPLAMVSSGVWQIEALLDEDSLADMNPQLNDSVSVRLRHRNTGVYNGRILAIEPVGSDRIEQEQLWQQSGGLIPVMPDNGRAQTPYFSVRIAIEDGNLDSLRSGMSAFVRMGRNGTIGSSLIRNATRFFGQLRLN